MNEDKPIKDPLLASIEIEADAFFTGKNHTKEQYDNWIILRLTKEVVEWKEKCIKLQTPNTN